MIKHAPQNFIFTHFELIQFKFLFYLPPLDFMSCIAAKITYYASCPSSCSSSAFFGSGTKGYDYPTYTCTTSSGSNAFCGCPLVAGNSLHVPPLAVAEKYAFYFNIPPNQQFTITVPGKICQ